MTLTPTSDDSILDGTFLVGTIDCSYDEVVEKFGEPHSAGDGYKTDAEWMLLTEDGKPVTIYNYKSGRNYEGAAGLDVKDIRDWHVGGHGAYALNAVCEIMGVQGRR